MVEIKTGTAERVPKRTADEVNRRIRRNTLSAVADLAERLEGIEKRLEELDQEWDIERTLEANAGTLALAGALLGFVSRRWNILPIIVGGFLVQHAIQGWCPPVPIFRRLGVRTMREIDEERYALKSLRGDFQEVAAQDDTDAYSKARKALESASST